MVLIDYVVLNMAEILLDATKSTRLDMGNGCRKYKEQRVRGLHREIRQTKVLIFRTPEKMRRSMSIFFVVSELLFLVRLLSVWSRRLEPHQL